ncbi:MAG: hypothetical protein V7K55_07750 [Nostoc sp.]|uniref:hypothetical protein n=1 Tax=Nostoc sp. TaxID=1180 RepID=UPI002FF63C75
MCKSECDRFTENIKNNAIAVVEERVRSHYRKPRKKRSLLWKSECDRFTENLKNKAIAYCERVSAIALQKTLKIMRSPIMEE